MTIELKILKAVLLLRKVGNKYQTKEEQIAEQLSWYKAGHTTEAGIDEWIEGLKEELRKTPEQREAESEEWIAQVEEAEACFSRRYRDEWDDLWADRARSCGAVPW